MEIQEPTISVHLHATAPPASCPRCGTTGSRVQSRYERTSADSAFGGRNLLLKLQVRTWICPEEACPQHIFAERFPAFVQRSARMTDRLTKVLQSTGVRANGADAAHIASFFGVPTTAKTVIRRVLQLPFPSEGEVTKVGRDEWAWKQGQRYGTILGDLEKRRVVQVVEERSVETSQAWFHTHPELEVVSRDRGKIFREAASLGAPQAKQVVDRFHLHKTLAEALETFFRKQEPALTKALQNAPGTPRPAAKTAVPEHIAQERRARHRRRVRLHTHIWKLFQQGHQKEPIAQLVGVSSSQVYRILKQETPPPPRRRSRSSSIVDPSLPSLTARWNQGCQNGAHVYQEIVEQGDKGTTRTLQLQLRPVRPHTTHPVSKQMVIWGKPPSPRGVALLMVRPKPSRPPEQAAYLDRLIESDETIAVVFPLVQDVGNLLRKREGQGRLEQWKAAVRTSGIAELIACVDGLADDAEAVANACSLTWRNGMVEGFVNNVTWIKRSSYGQAGCALLQRRVLLHPTAEKRSRNEPKHPGVSMHPAYDVHSTNLASVNVASCSFREPVVQEHILSFAEHQSSFFWPCGLIHASGMITFLCDSSQPPSLTASHRGEGFDPTMQATSTQIRSLWRMPPVDPDWSTLSMGEQNPWVWMLDVHGRSIDVLPRPCRSRRSPPARVDPFHP